MYSPTKADEAVGQNGALLRGLLKKEQRWASKVGWDSDFESVFSSPVHHPIKCKDRSGSFPAMTKACPIPGMSEGWCIYQTEGQMFWRIGKPRGLGRRAELCCFCCWYPEAPSISVAVSVPLHRGGCCNSYRLGGLAKAKDRARTGIQSCVTSQFKFFPL